MNEQGMTVCALLFFAVLSSGCNDPNATTSGSGSGGGATTGSGGGTTTGSDAVPQKETDTAAAMKCAPGYTCYAQPAEHVIWAMKDDGNLYGPDCSTVCAEALSQSCDYHACDEGRPVEHKDKESFMEIAAGLGFTCKDGGCWGSVAPGEGMYLVSTATDAVDGSKTCYFPDETTHSCSTAPGNANCFGERYSTVCPCVVKPLDEACPWSCPPNNTTRAVWKTAGTSCVERVNYWRRKACEEGWVECPPAGLPPMVECTACDECANSEAQWDSTHGAHASFTRCGELVQGEGGGATCADVIDAFVSERKPDKDGILRCEGHCGPILAPGCRTFSWGRAADSDFHTLNWDSCNVTACQDYCTTHPGECFTHDMSPSLTCEDPELNKEPGPQGMTCK
jgi:hypothetical protein